MGRSKDRISTAASVFAAFMQRTDNLQLAVGTPITTRKWQNWGWSSLLLVVGS